VSLTILNSKLTVFLRACRPAWTVHQKTIGLQLLEVERRRS